MQASNLSLLNKKDAMDFESDCEQLVELINREEDWPAMAVELDEIKAYATRFLEFSIFLSLEL